MESGLKTANGGEAKLHAIVVHQSSMSCGIFGLCFSAWFMHFGLGLGLAGILFVLVLGFGWVGAQLGLVLFEGGLSIGVRGILENHGGRSRRLG